MITLLIASGERDDHNAIDGLCRRLGWNAAHCHNWESAIQEMDRCEPAAVLVNGEWQAVLHYTSQMDNPPAIVVLSRLADNRLWAEALNLGAHDVLQSPVEDRELRHVMAWLEDEPVPGQEFDYAEAVS